MSYNYGNNNGNNQDGKFKTVNTSGLFFTCPEGVDNPIAFKTSYWWNMIKCEFVAELPANQKTDKARWDHNNTAAISLSPKNVEIILKGYSEYLSKLSPEEIGNKEMTISVDVISASGEKSKFSLGVIINKENEFEWFVRLSYNIKEQNVPEYFVDYKFMNNYVQGEKNYSPTTGESEGAIVLSSQVEYFICQLEDSVRMANNANVHAHRLVENNSKRTMSDTIKAISIKLGCQGNSSYSGSNSSFAGGQRNSNSAPATPIESDDDLPF